MSKDRALIKEAGDFVAEVLGSPLPADFGDALKDGVVLCEFLNRIKPGTVGKFKASKMPFVCMENINAFTAGVRKLGLPDENNFQTVDLWEQSNLKQVALCLVALKRHLGLGFQKGAGSMVEVTAGSTDQTTDAKALADKRASRAYTCRECNLPITSGRSTLGKHEYHSKCFQCKKCTKNLHGSIHHEYNDQPYCDKCILIVKPQSTKGGKVRDMGFKFK